LTPYLDTSALVKLVVDEADSAAVRRYVHDATALTSSALARVELRRAVEESHRRPAEALLLSLRLLPLTDTLLDEAGALQVPEVPFLRSLHALHLVSARLLPDVELLTYDDRMADAARALGLAVTAPRD